MRDLQAAFRLVRNVVGALVWVAGTAWLGLTTLWRAGVLLSRLKIISAQVRLCPRGHEVPVYGLWDCGCGNRIEGWAFAVCPICRETAGYVPCPVCGLPVRNPLLP